MEILFLGLWISVLVYCSYLLYRNTKVSNLFLKWNMAVYNSRVGLIDLQRKALLEDDIETVETLGKIFDKYTYDDLYHDTFNMGQIEAVFKTWKSLEVVNREYYDHVLEYLPNKNWLDKRVPW